MAVVCLVVFPICLLSGGCLRQVGATTTRRRRRDNPVTPSHFVSRVPSSFPVLHAAALLKELWCCLVLPMASSTERGATRAPVAPPPPLPPPPPEEVAAFYALVEKQTTASVLNRHTRAAELSERAAKHAGMLWGDNSLVVARLRVSEASYLRSMANASTVSSEQEALCLRAWTILVSVHALLLRRLADNTLLPGTNTEEEVTYYARTQALRTRRVTRPSPLMLPCKGWVLCLDTQRCLTPCIRL